MSLSLILLERIWQISLEVEPESTGRLMVRPSISVTDTIMGFLVLVAFYSTEKKNMLQSFSQVTLDEINPHPHLKNCMIPTDKMCFLIPLLSSTHSNRDTAHQSIIIICRSILCQSQYLQLQPGRRLSSHSVQSCAFQPFSAVGSVASWSETDETLQVLPRRKRD